MYMKHVLTSTQHRVLKLYIITLQITTSYTYTRAVASLEPTRRGRRRLRQKSQSHPNVFNAPCSFSKNVLNLLALALAAAGAQLSPSSSSLAFPSSLQLPSRSSSTSLNPIGTFSNKHVPPFSPWCCRCNSFASLTIPSLNLVASDSSTAPLSVVIKRTPARRVSSLAMRRSCLAIVAYGGTPVFERTMATDFGSAKEW